MRQTKPRYIKIRQHNVNIHQTVKISSTYVKLHQHIIKMHETEAAPGRKMTRQVGQDTRKRCTGREIGRSGHESRDHDINIT